MKSVIIGTRFFPVYKIQYGGVHSIKRSHSIVHTMNVHSSPLKVEKWFHNNQFGYAVQAL